MDNCIPNNLICEELNTIYVHMPYNFIIYISNCVNLYFIILLGPPAERQRSFSIAELSVCQSVRQDWGGGGEGVNLGNTKVTFSLFLAWSFFRMT